VQSPNILLSTNDILKISDFGTCRELCGDPEKLSFVGTVAWMAPEVIRSEDCSEKGALRALGVFFLLLLFHPSSWTFRPF
jgi:mitogen-activated protein kinase kinase kinase 13